MIIEIFKIVFIVIVLLLGLLIIKLFIFNIVSVLKKEKITIYWWLPSKGESWFNKVNFFERPIINTIILGSYFLASVFFLVLGIVGITRLI